MSTRAAPSAHPLVEPLGRQVHPGRRDRDRRSDTVAGGELEDDPGAEGHAQCVHDPCAHQIQVGLDLVGQGRDGGSAPQGR
jgi:hypothetical protein